MADSLQISQKEAGEAIDAFIKGIRKGLKKDGEVKLVNFGNFKVNTIKAHMGVNPKTGKKIEIGDRKRIVFRPGKELKEMIDKKPATEKKVDKAPEKKVIKKGKK
jgi:DNA-binding protein HU-beta